MFGRRVFSCLSSYLSFTNIPVNITWIQISHCCHNGGPLTHHIAARKCSLHLTNITGLKDGLCLIVFRHNFILTGKDVFPCLSTSFSLYRYPSKRTPYITDFTCRYVASTLSQQQRSVSRMLDHSYRDRMEQFIYTMFSCINAFI